jgi:hypothetical protein
MSYLSLGDYINPLWHSLILYFYLILAVVYLRLKRNSRSYFSPQWIYYFGIFLLCILSSFWSLDFQYTFYASFDVLKVLVVSLSIFIYIEDKRDLDYFFSLFVVGGLILILFLILDNKWNFSGERLGVGETGDYNIIAMAFLISALCNVYLISKSELGFKRYFLIFSYILMELTLLLIQGRKYIVFSLLILLFMFLKKLTWNPQRIVFYSILLFVFILFSQYLNAGFAKLVDNKVIADNRIVSPLNSNDEFSEDLLRIMMVEKGLEWFMIKPFFGYGHRGYELLFERISGERRYSHNNFVELLVNLGLVGFVVYYWNYIKLFFIYFTRYLNTQLGFFLSYLLFAFFLLDLVVVSYYSQMIVQIIILICGYVYQNRKLFLNHLTPI